jgi:hypothetical protein
MSTSRKPTASEELEHIEDALVETLMNASGDELRAEMTAAGVDPDTCIAEMDSAIASARADSARQRLEGARAALTAWRAKSGLTGDVEREAARARLQRLRSGDRALDEKLMMAARKGEGLSERDLEGLLEDLAELERLEREDGDE